MPHALTPEELATRRCYAVIAEDYAQRERDDYPDESVVDWRLSLPSDDPLILDIGCGFGRSIEVLRQVGITRYIGVDPCEELIAIARERYPGYDFRLGEARDIPAIVPEQCDGFLAVFSFGHIAREHLLDALYAIRSVMKPGAVGYISGPSGTGTWVGTSATHEHIPAGHSLVYVQWVLEDFLALAAEAGFEAVFPIGEDDYLFYAGLRAC
ncbi:MAG: class I SAM-dependent methyltransferase [Patescibacteria group bacterium]|nr:class I SAM-dependent methyltransferase [Patescibacteria group bacterium]MDE1944464.1 class I SAM-dependent methyltransferase [Patescibacteria group bacterium]MDE1945289.1 class I SAM-dependent methyltransferase [Patescibacteria group bacterium]MDE2057866.1 class I SAM-dependent methyltransferase [Patescibacteria group bacterium]